MVAVLDDRIVGFAIATAEAHQEANAVKVEADKKIAEQNTELAVQQAEMQVRADTKKAASPLAQTDKIVMYGDGNSTRLIRDVISGANQVVDGMKESTGIDLAALLAGFTGGKLAQKEE